MTAKTKQYGVKAIVIFAISIGVLGWIFYAGAAINRLGTAEEEIVEMKTALKENSQAHTNIINRLARIEGKLDGVKQPPQTGDVCIKH